jgi:hypothetical protein
MYRSVIGTILFIGLTVLNQYPHIFNYPTKITAGNAYKQFKIATRLIRYMKLAMTFIFTLIVFGTLQNAAGKSDGLGIWFFTSGDRAVAYTITILYIQIS